MFATWNAPTRQRTSMLTHLWPVAPATVNADAVAYQVTRTQQSQKIAKVYEQVSGLFSAREP